MGLCDDRAGLGLPEPHAAAPVEAAGGVGHDPGALGRPALGPRGANREALVEYLATLYPDGVPEGCLVLVVRGGDLYRVRRIALDRPGWTERVARDAADFEREIALDVADGRKPSAVYLALAARRKGLTGMKHGGQVDVVLVPALWVDLDFGSVGHKAAGLPPDEDAALRVLAAMGCPAPSILIHSGYGMYPIWLLAEPIVGPADRDTLAYRAHKSMAARLAAAGQATGFTVDTGPCQPASILRVPGASNWKVPENPRPVRVLECHPDRRYDLAELVPEVFQEPPPRPARVGPAAAERPAQTSADLLTMTADVGDRGRRKLADACAALRALKVGNRHNPCRSIVFALAGRSDVDLPDTATTLLVEAAIASGMDPTDASQTVEDAWKAGREVPYPPNGREGRDEPAIESDAAWMRYEAVGWVESWTSPEALIPVPPKRRDRVIVALAKLHARAIELGGPTLFVGAPTLCLSTGWSQKTARAALADVVALGAAVRSDPPRLRGANGRYVATDLSARFRLSTQCSLPILIALPSAPPSDHAVTMGEKAESRGIRAIGPVAPVDCAVAIHPRSVEVSAALASAGIGRVHQHDAGVSAPSAADAATAHLDDRVRHLTPPAAHLMTSPELAPLVGLGAARAGVLRAAAAAGDWLDADALARLLGRKKASLVRDHAVALERLGALEGRDVPTGGRPRREWRVTAIGRAALALTEPCEALAARRRREVEATRAAWDDWKSRADGRAVLDDAVAEDAEAGRTSRSIRVRAPRPSTQDGVPLITPTPDEAAAAAAHPVPDVPERVDTMDAWLDTVVVEPTTHAVDPDAIAVAATWTCCPHLTPACGAETTASRTNGGPR